MYPYHQKTNLYSSTLTAKESALTDYSKDKRLISLLRLAQAESTSLEAFYRNLLSLAEPNDAQNIRSLWLDEKKHLALLENLLYHITGKRSEKTEKTTVQQNESEMPTTLTDGLSYAFQKELADADFFRELYLNLPPDESRDVLFEIMSDKQNHAMLLCMLSAHRKNG